MITAYAKITVAVAGTPERITKNETSPGDSHGCHGVLVQALPTNTGIIFIGNRLMNKSAYTGILAFLPVPTTNTIPSWSAALTMAPGAIQLRDLYIDAAVAGDGVIVSILVT